MHDLPNGVAVRNKLLAALSPDEFHRLNEYSDIVEMPSGTVVYRQEDRYQHIYFSNGALFSVVGHTVSGHATEIGIFGTEGLCCPDAFLGADISNHETIAQLPGSAIRVSLTAAREEFAMGGTFQSSVLDLTRKFMGQLAQNVVCSRLHPLEERLARWLLLCADRVDKDDLPITQEFLAVMTGSTRASVTLSAIALREEGLIHYSRGKVKLINKEGLKAVACECYAEITRIYNGEQ